MLIIQFQTTAAQVRLEMSRGFFCKVILRSTCHYSKFEGLQTVSSSDNHANLWTHNINQTDLEVKILFPRQKKNFEPEPRWSV